MKCLPCNENLSHEIVTSQKIEARGKHALNNHVGNNCIPCAKASETIKDSLIWRALDERHTFMLLTNIINRGQFLQNEKNLHGAHHGNIYSRSTLKVPDTFSAHTFHPEKSKNHLNKSKMHFMMPEKCTYAGLYSERNVGPGTY